MLPHVKRPKIDLQHAASRCRIIYISIAKLRARAPLLVQSWRGFIDCDRCTRYVCICVQYICTFHVHSHAIPRACSDISCRGLAVSRSLIALSDCDRRHRARIPTELRDSKQICLALCPPREHGGAMQKSPAVICVRYLIRLRTFIRLLVTFSQKICEQA